jgi:hypothetical protein
MTAHLSMNTVVHAAVRRDLSRFRAALADFPVGSAERADDLNRAWQNLDAQLHHHHEGEETIFWPALRALGADQVLVSDLDGEHRRMADAMVGARTAMAALAGQPDADRRDAAQAAFAELTGVVETHFAHEERDLEPMMAKVHDTPKMKEAGNAIRRTMSPAEAGAYLTWLGDGADPDAKAFLRHEIPAPVLFIFTRLFGRSYRRGIAPVWA